jgi:hypothetical protein
MQGPPVEIRVIEEKIKVKVSTSQALLHLAGMAALTVGVFATLKGIFGGESMETAQKIANVV